MSKECINFASQTRTSKKMETIVSALEVLEYWLYRNVVYRNKAFKYESGYDSLPLGAYMIGNMVNKNETDRIVHIGNQYFVFDYQFSKN